MCVENMKGMIAVERKTKRTSQIQCAQVANADGLQPLGLQACKLCGKCLFLAGEDQQGEFANQLVRTTGKHVRLFT